MTRRAMLCVGTTCAAGACLMLSRCAPSTTRLVPRTDLTAEQLQALMTDGQPLLLVDVRTPEEYAEGHIPGSVNHPKEQYATWVGSIEPGTRLCTICQSGGRSAQVADALAASGYTRVYNLLGGIDAWTGALESALEAAAV